MDLEAGVEMGFHVCRELSDILVACVDRHIDPKISASPVRGFHQYFDGDSMAPRRLVHRGAVRPCQKWCVGNVGRSNGIPTMIEYLVGVHPLHKADGAKVIDSGKKRRIEREARLVERKLTLRHHVHIADIVAGVVWIWRENLKLKRP